MFDGFFFSLFYHFSKSLRRYTIKSSSTKSIVLFRSCNKNLKSTILECPRKSSFLRNSVFHGNFCWNTGIKEYKWCTTVSSRRSSKTCRGNTAGIHTTASIWSGTLNSASQTNVNRNGNARYLLKRLKTKNIDIFPLN